MCEWSEVVLHLLETREDSLPVVDHSYSVGCLRLPHVLKTRPFHWHPPAQERHSRNAVVFAFPIGLRNCDLAERSSRVISRPRLN